MAASSLCHLFISSWAAVAVFILSLSSILGGAISVKSTDIIQGPLLTSKIATNRTILVGPKEEFQSVQAAIDAVPDGNSQWIIIHLRAGIYREKVVIPERKSYIFLRGNGKGRTAILWDESCNNNTESASFSVWADNIIVFGISFKNDALVGAPDAPFKQSVAAMVAGDKVAFYHCAFYSAHNTLFDHKGRHYYESCYIQGNIDFIFGRGQSIFQSCEIFVLTDRRTKILGSITAQNRQSADEDSGFVFLKGKIYGIGNVYLGRAKGAHSRVIFSKTYLSKTITPDGWTHWSYDGSANHLLHGEHDCHGPGADTAQRVPWARQLTDEEAAPFISIDFINGKEWLPAYYY
ncbi:probable pectinesterase 67 [Phoenix dactylifera]|uniref:pectinesterase n=1 Tax=Phoenix dactylifera TaxID=42345 RepID=A0A8B7BM45_PHODC|nr:probable pectinesterase 67 [Phoenix dactylifera]